MRLKSKAAQRGSGKVILILLIVLIVLLLAVGSAAALYLTGMISVGGNGNGEAEQQEVAVEEAQPPPRGPAEYMELDDAITVNIQREDGRRAILQARMQFMARDESVFEGVERHMPLIRNNLIMLFSDQSFDGVATSDGKDALRQEALEVVNDVLESEGEPPQVEAVYFTDFVTQ